MPKRPPTKVMFAAKVGDQAQWREAFRKVPIEVDRLVVGQDGYVWVLTKGADGALFWNELEHHMERTIPDEEVIMSLAAEHMKAALCRWGLWCHTDKADPQEPERFSSAVDGTPGWAFPAIKPPPLTPEQRVIRGLQIMTKYQGITKGQVNSGHDAFWAGPDPEQTEADDVAALVGLGWHPDTDAGCWEFLT